MSRKAAHRIRVITAAATLAAIAGTPGCRQQPELEKLEESLVAKPADTVTLELNGYDAPNGRIFRHLFVSNFSVRLVGGNLEYSASRDGLTDALKRAEETRYGFTVGRSDWNSDGFGDLLIYLSGIPAPNQATLYCGPAQRVNSANDAFIYNDSRLPGSPQQVLGLRDCEKSFLQLNPLSFDNDADGIPDYLEMRAGLNPRNAKDADLDVSGTGLSNLERVKRNIPVDESSKSQPNELYAYQYSTNFDISGNRKFTVSNIPVLNGGLDNFIAVYITEKDLTTSQDTLYSAYMILPANSAGRIIHFDFWATLPGHGKTNEEIALK